MENNDVFNYSIHYKGPAFPNLVIKKLRDIGYEIPPMKNSNEQEIEFFLYKNGKCSFSILDEEQNGMILCTNYYSLVQVAALRDDSDKYQWFTDDFNHWEKCPNDKANIPAWVNFYQAMPHKATISELISRFDGIKIVGCAWR